MKNLILFIAVFSLFCANAQNEAIFNHATTAYNNGEYEKAVENYHKILENGQHSVSVYFNLGNSYYKLNKIAPSIYYYEKALLLNPNDPEIVNNLAYAQNMTLDAIEVMPETSISKFYKNVTNMLSFDQWAYLAIALIMLFVLAYIAFYYLQYATHKRIAFITSVIALILMVLSISMAFIQFQDFNSQQPAIVFAEEVRVNAEPNDRSSEAFVLHEGTKVNVLEALNDFHKIKLADGKVGWIQKDAIKLLKDF